MSTASDRRDIWEWFRSRGVETSVATFIEIWHGHISSGQGATDLRWLWSRGHLVKRVDYDAPRPARHRYPVAYYTAVGEGPPGEGR